MSLFALVLALPLAGATFAAQPGTTETSPSSMPSDTWLTKQVRHQLILLPYYDVFDNLEFRVEGSTVTLMGQVVRPDLKDDATATVKHIEGVTQVNNQIQVLSLSPMDWSIRRAEYRAIYSKPSLEIYRNRSVPPIHIIVDHGHVTLEGVVANENDKNLAGIAANQVPYVFSVTNNLRVENT
ncbi:MAG TPA: BON domain-containing protein [Candidatus Aquilonibacter sp.]|nr:BON domain-containing protein [Candidatus Aquilonibacter sp.]